MTAKDYLEKQYSVYCKLVENSNTLSKKSLDKLAPLPETSLLIEDSSKNGEKELMLTDIVKENV
jgi:hypothetical protein